MQNIMNDAIEDMNRGLQQKQIQQAGNIASKPTEITPTIKGIPTVETKVAVAQKTRPATMTSAETVNTSTQLMKLKELKDAGLLTEEEYETKRKELVGQL